MYWDRYDICMAHYTFCMDYHEGQWSPLYARLCRIGKYLKPSLCWDGKPENENQREIYNALVLKHTGKEPDTEDEDEIQDDDYVIGDCGPLGSRYSVGISGGKFMGEYKGWDEAVEAIKEKMEEE